VSALAAELARLEQGLEALLSSLEGPPSAEFAPLEAAFTTLEGAFARVQAETQRSPAELEVCEERVSRCRRLYAVALGMLAELREALIGERATCAGARARLERLQAGAPSGGSCDLSA
jgi:chromosome segregation ATPase